MGFTSHLLRIYQHLPGPLRGLAASARGYYLQSFRYGPDTERVVEEALARERWDPEKWKAWQQERLSRILHRAVHEVPFYREQWAERRRRGDKASWEDLANWPILDKDTVRLNPRAFLVESCNPDKMFSELTSGSTNKPLDLWWSRETTRSWFALFEARWRRWYGLTRQDRWGMLGGKLIVPVSERRPPFWVWNAGMNQLYMSAWHIAPDLAHLYLDAILKHKVVYLYGYTSSMYALAVQALRLGRRDVKMKVCIANAEPVFEYQKKAIEEAFQCKLRETYGMAELIGAASECDQGNLHLWPEIGIVEIVEDGQIVTDGTTGDLIGTGLLNDDMPLIRYRVGDRARVPVNAAPCACGRTMPRLAGIDGRTDDVFYTSDGRVMGRVGPVFSAPLNIIEAQAIQEEPDRIRIRFVAAPNWTPEDGRKMIMRVQERVGRMDVVIEPVDHIPRGPNGKFRSVLCKLTPEVRRELLEKAARRSQGAAEPSVK